MYMMDQVIEFFAQQQVLIILAALFAVLILFVIFFKARQSSSDKQLKELEILYNKAKSVPLSFKLNKAIALAKTNEHLFDKVAHAQDNFKDVEQKLKQVSIMLADIEDAILINKVKQANTWSEETKEILDALLASVENLNNEFDSILEDETQQRSQITKLKDEFRLCKSTLANQSNVLSHSMQVLQDEVVAIENMFTSFEEWMYASEFDKAKEKANEIEQNIDLLKQQLKILPDLISRTKGTLPAYIDDVNDKYKQLKTKNVHVDHLDIPRNIEMISSTLKDDLVQLRNGVTTKVDEHCDESEKRLKQLKEALIHEEKAFDESSNLLEDLHKAISENTALYETLIDDVNNVGYRYGLKASQSIIEPSKLQLDKTNDAFDSLGALLDEYKVPASSITMSVKEQLNLMQQLNHDLSNHVHQFSQAKHDEARANKQLLKLHLIVNEIQVKIAKHRLPAISDSYRGDLNKAKQMTQTIHAILETDPLDTRRLNTLVNESIDFTYKLYNNINNIVGMVDMIESGIVFANKYRSSMEFMDSELTRSELSFRNGEYTQALSIVLGAIEKLHPESFEQLVKDNAKSAAGV